MWEEPNPFPGHGEQHRRIVVDGAHRHAENWQQPDANHDKQRELPRAVRFVCARDEGNLAQHRQRAQTQRQRNQTRDVPFPIARQTAKERDYRQQQRVIIGRMERMRPGIFGSFGQNQRQTMLIQHQRHELHVAHFVRPVADQNRVIMNQTE